MSSVVKLAFSMNTTTQISLPKPAIFRTLLVIILSALAGLVFYQEAIATVMAQVVNRSDSSHGIFVPIITAYFLWMIKDRIRETVVDYFWAYLKMIPRRRVWRTKSCALFATANMLNPSLIYVPGDPELINRKRPEVTASGL